MSISCPSVTEELDLGQLGCLDHRVVTLQNVAPLCLVVMRACMCLSITVSSTERASAPANIGGCQSSLLVAPRASLALLLGLARGWVQRVHRHVISLGL